MTFLNFLQLSKSIFRPKLKENTFLKTKPNFYLTVKCFPLTEKCFMLTNFSNNKQTHESLKNNFPKTTFPKTNTTLIIYFHNHF